MFIQMPFLTQRALSTDNPTWPPVQHTGSWELPLPSAHAALLVGLRTCFSWHLASDSPRQHEYLYGSQSPELEAEASGVECSGRESIQNGLRRGSSSRLQGILQSPQRKKHPVAW